MSAFVLLVVAGICWGTGGVTGRALASAGDVSAPSVAAYRLLVGGALLVLVLLVMRRWPRSRAAWLRVLTVAALAAAFQASYFAAIAVSSVTLATLIAIGSAPLLVLVADTVSTRRLPHRGTVRPVVVGIAGLALLVGAPSGGTVAGVGLAVLAGAGFAALTLIGRRPVAGLDEATTTGYGFLLGGMLLLPVADGVAVNASTVGLLAFLGTVPTALAYTLYFRGLRSSSAVTATVVALLEPLTAAVLAAALFGERLSVPATVGAVLLLGSIVDRYALDNAVHLTRRERVVGGVAERE
ncbi:DMT family transporter [Cryptosporangium sp. NPDC048952]|uniref:DMT family transporter n=1 Tax=Cryptosporangium sp. NPDC048952 TaxID=3363961 RepID=UPI00371A0ACB